MSWQSRLQTSVALSSMESEYMAASAVAQEAIWLNRLLGELGFKTPKPITIYEENKAQYYFQITLEIIGDPSTSIYVSTS